MVRHEQAMARTQWREYDEKNPTSQNRFTIRSKMKELFLWRELAAVTIVKRSLKNTQAQFERPPVPISNNAETRHIARSFLPSTVWLFWEKPLDAQGSYALDLPPFYDNCRRKIKTNVRSSQPTFRTLFAGPHSGVGSLKSVKELPFLSFMLTSKAFHDAASDFNDRATILRYPRD